jgi:hypothetical protein
MGTALGWHRVPSAAVGPGTLLDKDSECDLGFGLGRPLGPSAPFMGFLLYLAGVTPMKGALTYG